jgi:hypothetical protein
VSQSQGPPRPGDLRPVQLETLPSVAGNRTGGQAGSESVGTPAVLTIGFGYQVVDSGNPARLRFEVVQQMMWVRRVRLSFSLLPAVFVAQTGTVGAGNTGAQSNDHGHSFAANSGVEGNGHIHNLGSTDNTLTAPPNGPVLRDGAGTYMMIAPNATASATFVSAGESATHLHGVAGNTGGESAGHTHSIAGGSITLSPATALGNTGMARGSRITIDGTDYTVQLGGPWGAGAQTDISDLDLSKIQTAGKQSIWKRGFHEIDLSSTAIGGIMAQLLVVGTVNAT